MMIDIPVIEMRKGAKIPEFGSEEAAGADVHAYAPDGIILKSGAHYIVPTGVGLDIPRGFEVQVRPRSGLAAKFGVTVLNAPGTIDSDYTGEIGVILINHGGEDFWITHGDRIAQLVVKKVELPQFKWAINSSKETARGDKGFGSTGV